MMINKKLSILAGAVLAASSAQAAFDSDSVVFVAVNGAGDTYVHDLGSISEFVAAGATGVNVDPSYVGGSYTWTVVGTSDSGSKIDAAAPPAYSPNADFGIVTTGAGATSTIANNNSVNNEVTAVQNWLAAVGAVATGDSANIAGTSGDAFSAGQAVAHQGSAMQSNIVNYVGGLTGFYQASAAASPAGGLSAHSTVGISDLYFNGSNVSVSAVPVPAAAWLFGSALAGLTVIRRRK